MRRALVVGIDQYEHFSPLTGAVNDAISVEAMLARNADGSVNFDVRLITAIERKGFKEAARELFAGDGEVALLYFAGHGYLEATGGYLCATDSQTGDDGFPLAELMKLANPSRIQNRIIILDSCRSGIAGDHSNHDSVAEIKDGITILTASTAEQNAKEENGAGVFTALLVDALNGAAANLVGDITPGSVYAHIDQSLGSWAQRPVFKTNVKQFVSLRKVRPPLELCELRRISELFPQLGFEFHLDPSYEPERPPNEPLEISASVAPPPDPEKNAIFSILQKYNHVGLLVPQGVPHMWHAAMQSKSVRLTALGEHYRRLASKGRI